ncbi:MAG TPA: hypothetical protein VK892_17600 [Pyrinomonadaceae bacterium]|nr:hypothetical protein [Pyrinomonadaceae bacterium]
MPGKDYPKFDREITIDDLYPDLSPEEQREAEYRLLRYLAVVKRIFERISRENPELLTELERRAMLRKKRDSSDKS